jgi:hypothetical protein
MDIRKRVLTLTTAATLAFGVLAGPALAHPSNRAVQQTGGAAGLVAAVVQANITDVEVVVVEVGDVNVTVQNVLNNARILNNVLRNADIDVVVTDVVDVAIVENVLVINVLSSSNIANLA